MRIVIDHAFPCGEVQFHIEEAGRRVHPELTRFHANVGPELCEAGRRRELLSELLSRVMRRAQAAALKKNPYLKRERTLEMARDRMRRWRAESPEESLEDHRRYVESHPEAIKEANRRGEAKRRGKRKAYNKAYRAAHLERMKAANKAYYESHRKEIAESNRRYREAHRDAIRAYQRRWYLRKKEESRND